MLKHAWSALAVLVLPLALAATDTIAVEPTPLEQNVAAFMASAPWRQDGSPAQVHAAIAARLTESGLDEALDGAAAESASEAKAVFDMAFHSFFYTSDPRYLGGMERALAALRENGADTAKQRMNWYRSLVQARAFDQAKAFRAAHGGDELTPLPEHINDVDIAPGTASVWNVTGPDTIQRVPLDLDSLSMVVVGSPGCQFFRKAVEAIGNDPELRPLFDSDVIWIAPEGDLLGANSFWQWNTSHPLATLAIVHRQHELPEIEEWGTPGFHFLLNGKVVEQVIGWPEGQRGELLAAASRAKQLRSP